LRGGVHAFKIDQGAARNVIRRTSVFVLEILAGLVAGGVILALVGAWWLSSGPVSLTFLTPYIERALSPEDGTMTVEVEDTFLIWAGWERAVDIQVTNVRLLDFEREALAVLPEVAVGLSLPAMMRGIVAPTSLEIVSPKVTGVRTKDSHVVFGFTTGDPSQQAPKSAMLSRLMTDLLGAPDPTRPLGYLKKVSIRDADFSFEDQKLGNTRRAPRSDIEFRRDKSGIKVAGVLDLDLDGRKSRVDGSVAYIAETGDLDIALEFSGIDPGLVGRNSSVDFIRKLSAFNLSLSGKVGVKMNVDGLVKAVQLDIASRLGEARGSLKFHPDGYNYSAEFDVSGVPVARLSEILPEYPNLAGFQARAAGRVQIDGAIDGRVAMVDFDLGVEAGVLDAPKIFTAPIEFTKGRLRGRIDDGLSRFKVSEARLSFKQGAAVAHVTGARVGDDFNFHLNGELSDISAERLMALWPPSASIDARNWVRDNLIDGLLEDGRVGLVARIENGDTKKTIVESLNGSARVSGAKLTYFKPLPAVTDVSGEITFTKERLDIVINGGRLKDLKTREGAVHITGLNVKDQDIAIDLVAEGPLGTAIQLLDMKPLGLIGKLELDSGKIHGDVAARLKFEFPLSKSLKVVDIGIAAAANLRDVSLDTGVNDWRLEDGAFLLRLTGQEMNISGDATLNGVPATLKWREDFARTGGVRSQVEARARLGLAELKALGVPRPPFLTGASAVKIDFTNFDDGRGEIVVSGGLQELDVNVPMIGWRKPTDAPGDLYLFIKLAKDGGIIFEDVRVSTPGFRLNAGLTPTQDFSGVRRVDLRLLEYNDNQMKGTINALENGRYDIRLSGKRIDISSFLDKVEDIGDLAKETPLAPLSIRAKFDEVLIGEGRELKNVTAALQRSSKHWTRIRVDGGLGKDNRVRINYGPTTKNYGLRISSSDAGQTLSALGWSKRIKGGDMIVVGRQEKPGAPMVGRFRFGRFKAREAPALARILQVLSLTGIFSALDQNGLDFETFEGEFDYFGGALHFPRARAFGSDLGVTLEGYVYLHNQTTEMSGTIVPAYTVNRVLGKIPVLGGLLTGGKDQGLFAANYKLSGSLEEPKVSVNPLSILAPGILRRLFSGDVEALDEPAFESEGD
jgi:hypothetical protein